MQKYGLLGHPLGHSFSKKFHNDRFVREGIAAIYDNFDLPDIADLPRVLMSEPELSGLNVTIPYKQAIIPFLDELDDRAARIGAVNVVKITRMHDATIATRIPGLYLKGYNSDVVGFIESIRPMLFIAPAAVFGKEDLSGLSDRSEFCPHTKALLLGRGGAGKAVAYALRELGIEPQYVSRSAAPGVLSYEQLTPEIMESHTVVVNCSPVGMYPHTDECPAIPYACLTPKHVCFDLIYNPAETLFLKRAAAQGAAVKCGQEMLEGQALESYRLWTE